VRLKSIFIIIFTKFECCEIKILSPLLLFTKFERRDESKINLHYLQNNGNSSPKKPLVTSLIFILKFEKI
jgi:hypothetical protein